ncbi:uncharacterized protein LOC135832018 isoform X1 [Planococcus citri]|uniref:uncharacterized protein LOC135832018 isoform X1 n=1 Tax=Planococcus citri TaxID=170843 RepID=UPI0031F8CA2C
MSVVKTFANATNIDDNDRIKFHRTKIVAAKETLRLLRNRLHLLKASNSQVQRELLADLTKLEHALSLAVHEMQKVVTKRHMIQLALERSIFSTLLYLPEKKLFDAIGLNDIEHCIADNLKSMLTQAESLKEKKETSDTQFIKMTNCRDELADVVDEIATKLNDQGSSESDEIKKQRLAKKCDNINMLRSFFSALVAAQPMEDCKMLVPLVWKWRTHRSYEYYQNRISYE